MSAPDCTICGNPTSVCPCTRQPTARELLVAAAGLLRGPYTSTMYEDQCGYLAEQIDDFLRTTSNR